MTRQAKKDHERFFAEQAARSLGKNWSFNESIEQPDFIVTEAGHRFGLEVMDIFTGPQTHSGSSLKASESVTQNDINIMQRKYEAKANTSLHVRFVGMMNTNNMSKVLPALLTEDFQSKPISYHTVIDTDGGLRVHVTKSLRPDWFSVNHRVGFVDRDSNVVIRTAVAKKAKLLATYQKVAGTDIRLLLVANRIYNSGKLNALVEGKFNLEGFSAVYFFPYPEKAISL